MEEQNRGRLFVISGPSGTGKGTICSELVRQGEASLSVSMTTRAPREHEEEGRSYFFTDKAGFRDVVQAGGFFEHAEVYGEFYGTPKGPVLEHLTAGRDVILEIDVNGAMQVRESMPEAVLVFIMPPSRAELKRRIESRGTETPERIEKRLERSEGEIASLGDYDYCVVNDDLNLAVLNVTEIIHAERAGETESVGRLKAPAAAEEIIRRYMEAGGKNVT